LTEKKFLMETMTWMEVSEALKDTDIVMIPIGSQEPHGPHCPLSTDGINASAVAKRTAEKLIGEFPILVTPLIPVGCSFEHRDFAGFISLKTQTLMELLKDVCYSLSVQGFKKVIVVNGHGGNTAALQAAANSIRDDMGLRIGVVTWWDLLRGEIVIDHAGWVETSMVMANRPELVDGRKIPKDQKKRRIEKEEYNVMTPMPPLKNIAPEGYIGDPEKASVEKGRELTERASDRLAQYIREIRKKGHLIDQGP
jgi:creatinine amidohydrolase